MPSIDDYLLSAWQQMSPGSDKRKEGLGFPRGFWPDVARLAVTQALAGYSDRALAEAEELARLRYRADPVWAAMRDNELTGSEKHSRLKNKGKSKKQIGDELLGEIKI